MPKKQVYSPLNAADEESQHEYSQYRDDPDDHETMPSSSASIKSALSKKSRKSRRRVDNDELSVPLHALSEDGGDGHDVESGTASGAVMGAHSFLKKVTSATMNPPTMPPMTQPIGCPTAMVRFQVKIAPHTTNINKAPVFNTVPLMVIELLRS